MANINQLRRIISNGYVHKTRQLLKSQAIGLTGDEILAAMTISNIKIKPFTFNSKHKVTSLVSAVNPKTCNVVQVTDPNTFNKLLASIFKEVGDLSDDGSSKLSYFIKKGDENIGVFSMAAIDDTIRLGDFGIKSEYRGSKTIMEAILALRDKVIDFAKQKGISKIATEVNDGNQQLLSLYQRFGFKPVAEVKFNSPCMGTDEVQYLLEAII